MPEDGRIKKGFAMIMVVLMMLPLIFICGYIMESVMIEQMINKNLSSKQQSLYNAEAGIIDAKERVSSLDFKGGRWITYYVTFPEFDITGTELPNGSKDAVAVQIEARRMEVPPNYVITATGVYNGCTARLQQKYVFP